MKGLRARGGFVVDMEWKEEKLLHASIRSDFGTEIRVKYKNHSIELDTESGEIYLLDGALMIQ